MLNVAAQARGMAGSTNPTNFAGGSGSTAAAPQRVFLSHTSDLGKYTEPGSFVAAAVEAVLRARHAVTDMAYLAALAVENRQRLCSPQQRWARGSTSVHRLLESLEHGD